MANHKHNITENSVVLCNGYEATVRDVHTKGQLEGFLTVRLPGGPATVHHTGPNERKPMHKITKYQTIISSNQGPVWLDEAVCVAIENGWQPFGSPYLNVDSLPCQAMVQYDEVHTSIHHTSQMETK